MYYNAATQLQSISANCVPYRKEESSNEDIEELVNVIKEYHKIDERRQSKTYQEKQEAIWANNRNDLARFLNSRKVGK